MSKEWKALIIWCIKWIVVFNIVFALGFYLAYTNGLLKL